MPKITLENGQVVNISQESYDALKESVGKWKPEQGEAYYYFDEFFEVLEWEWENMEADKKSLKSGNCFRTREDAERAAGRMRAYLAGEDVKEGEVFWFWDFEDNDPYESKSYLFLLPHPKFRTKEACEAWYKEYGKYFE